MLVCGELKPSATEVIIVVALAVVLVGRRAAWVICTWRENPGW